MIWPFSAFARRSAHRRRLALACAAFARLPEDIQAALWTTPIRVLDKPTAKDRELGIPADVSGVFAEDLSVHLEDEEHSGSQPRVGVISLYFDNIDPCTPEGIAGVLLHEASHLLGLDDHHAEACGL